MLYIYRHILFVQYYHRRVEIGAYAGIFIFFLGVWWSGMFMG